MNIDKDCPICIETRLNDNDKVQHDNGTCNKFFHRTCIKTWVETKIRNEPNVDEPGPIACPACRVREGFSELIQIERGIRRKVDAENEPIMTLFERPGRRGNGILVVRRRDLPILFRFATIAVVTVAVVLGTSYMRQR
ncbi:RING finger domain-containing protein [Endozoicomonas lisbonensis]|uniref:RING-type domain-containing protein n=1 Tax=Endozoicomonas lisbonensis TaxID=3120522 RepID=A0ABV2SK86_9GAMM